MKTWIALLRGINVSGQKKIPMAELREILSDAGLEGLHTYIQSGNILFRSDREADALAVLISDRIRDRFGFEVPVELRHLAQWEEIFATNPFLNDGRDEAITALCTAFLSEEPKQEGIDRLASRDYADQEYRLRGREVYLFLPKGAGRADLSNNYLEKKLKVRATSRNWKTVTKLLEMARAL